jgi:hypothetical protein
MDISVISFSDSKSFTDNMLLKTAHWLGFRSCGMVNTEETPMNTIRHALLLALSYATAATCVAGSLGMLAFLLARLFTLGLGGAAEVCDPNDFASFFH